MKRWCIYGKLRSNSYIDLPGATLAAAGVAAKVKLNENLTLFFLPKHSGILKLQNLPGVLLPVRLLYD